MRHRIFSRCLRSRGSHLLALRAQTENDYLVFGHRALGGPSISYYYIVFLFRSETAAATPATPRAERILAETNRTANRRQTNDVNAHQTPPKKDDSCTHVHTVVFAADGPAKLALTSGGP